MALQSVRPPKPLLFGAVLAVIASGGLLFADGLAMNMAGYVLAGFMAIGLVTAFSRVDNRRKLDPWYSPEPGLRPTLPVVSFAALLMSFAHAWQLATRFAS